MPHIRDGAAAADADSPAASAIAEDDGELLPESHDLGQVLAELEEIGAIDPALKEKLIADLRSTKPSMWEPTIQVYRSALAYRKQQAELAAQGEPADPTRRAHAQHVDRQTMLAHLPPTNDSPPTGPLSPAAADAQNPAKLASHASPAEHTPSARLAAKPAHDDQPVRRASAEQPHQPAKLRPVADEPADDWQAHLQRAIAALERETGEQPASEAEVRAHAMLRMLYLAADRRQQALSPIDGVSAAQQDYWKQQLYSISTYLDNERLPDGRRRAAEARRYLNEAAARLGEMSTLSVRNLAFCREVKSYGVYETFKTYEFAPGQEVLLYAEVENFKSEETAQGHHTSIRSSYQILDSRGARVDEHDFAVTEEYCQNPRRDFFMRYFIWMPKRIYDGRYTLQLTIEDDLSKKIGQASIEFEIKEEGK